MDPVVFAGPLADYLDEIQDSNIDVIPLDILLEPNVAEKTVDTINSYTTDTVISDIIRKTIESSQVYSQSLRLTMWNVCNQNILLIIGISFLVLILFLCEYPFLIPLAFLSLIPSFLVRYKGFCI